MGLRLFLHDSHGALPVLCGPVGLPKDNRLSSIVPHVDGFRPHLARPNHKQGFEPDPSHV